MKLITFAVPAYNSEAYLDIAITSLLKGGEEVEIIIVDDGSNDKTPEIADSYRERFPSIVKVIHEVNGGHGEAINNALKEATGLYFKPVDSDDWVEEKTLKDLLSYIRKGVDLPDAFICGYDYHYGRGNIVKQIRYGNVFPKRKIFGWKKVGLFLPKQYLTIHSCMYKTSVIRESNVVLPRKTYYEDNYFIYSVLPYTHLFYYLDEPFYCYLVGRVGQSVSKDVSCRHYEDYLRVAKLAFTKYDIFLFKKNNPQLYKTMYQHLRMIFATAVMFTRLNGSEEATQAFLNMREEMVALNPHQAKKFIVKSALSPIFVKGKIGLTNVRVMYWLAHKVVKFN